MAGGADGLVLIGVVGLLADGRALTVGGVAGEFFFFELLATDEEALAAWYADTLGLTTSTKSIPIRLSSGSTGVASVSRNPFEDTRNAWVPDFEESRPVPVYRRDDLRPGMELAGPCLVEESQCTLVIGRGKARVLPGETVLAEVAP